ncbi:MAG: 5-oxoprolinase subunit B family protein [Ferrimicrobium sp.]|uniref:Allophanate hydrolase subunit 1 n=1 Tax=Ferrimicrobium acidiphilum TaxID=121039 RepID=A0ABV3Y3H0_9ACTN|nr:allophanate hydrolase subunit 1 [Ferrimicrobium sp.]
MKILPVGERALLIELEDLESVLGLYAEIEQRRKGGWHHDIVDVVPAARTILLDGISDPDAAATELTGWKRFRAFPTEGPLVELETIYDGDDLHNVAKICNLSPSELIAAHGGVTFMSAFCGFSPGFTYLSGLPDELQVPRLNNPRPSVPAGAVALADEFCAVYPRSSPGGWQIIGHTETSVWDSSKDPPTLLQPGTRVRFVRATS